MTKKRDPDLEDFDDEDEGSTTSEVEKQKPALSHLSYDELIAELTAAESKANENWETVLRMQAEMENMRRRHEQTLAQTHKYSLEKIAREILQVVDNLERGLGQMTADEVSPLRTGVELTLKQLQSVLEKFSIKVLDPALGSSFDPTLHEAMTTRASDEVAPGSILEVLQKGYQLHDRLLRPALVVVAKND